MTTRRPMTAGRPAAEPGSVRREVVVSIVSFVILLAAWTGLQWLVRDRLDWSTWVEVVVLGALSLVGGLTAWRSGNADVVAAASTAQVIGLVGAVLALGDALDRPEGLVIWVAAAVLVAGQLAFRWVRRGRPPGRAAEGAP
jgi:O-antigen/teichoic acid export membrane protein